jgi:hypothetical protein
MADLLDIIEFDLANTYTSVGNQVFKQHKGCPMGGMLSSFYGNATCAYHENTYLNSTPYANHIWGIRQMDDLTLFIAHSLDDTDAPHNVEVIKNDIEHNVYKGGLEAEVQPPDEDTPTKVMHKFAGHEVHVYKDMTDIYTTTLNENKIAIRTTGRQAKLRYPNMHTYTNHHVKMGNITGSIHRIREQNTHRHHFTEAIDDLIAELISIGYSNTLIRKCMFKLTGQAGWATMLEQNIHKLYGKVDTKHTAGEGKTTRTTPKKYRTGN